MCSFLHCGLVQKEVSSEPRYQIEGCPRYPGSNQIDLLSSFIG